MKETYTYCKGQLFASSKIIEGECVVTLVKRPGQSGVDRIAALDKLYGTEVFAD